jgi:hypothetical protein
MECLVEKAKKECECFECKSRRYWNGLADFLAFQERVIHLLTLNLQSEKDKEKIL